MTISDSTRAIWTFLQGGIGAIQISSLVWTHSFEWPDAVLDALNALAYLRVDVVDDVFIALFIVLTSLINVFVLGFGTMLLLGCECCEDNVVDEYITFLLGDAVLFGALFIPTFSFIFEMYNCVELGGVPYVFKAQEVECWTGIHGFFLFWAALCVVCLVVGSFLRAGINNTMAHMDGTALRLRKNVKYFDTKYQLYRLIVVMVGVFISVRHPISSAAIFFVFSLVPLIYTLKSLPYVNVKFNYLRTAFFSFTTWSFFLALITAAVNDSENLASSILIFVYPLFIGLSLFICHRQDKKHPAEEEASKNNLAAMAGRDNDKLNVIYNHQTLSRYSQEFNLNPNNCVYAALHGDRMLVEFCDELKSREDLECVVIENNKPSHETTSKDQPGSTGLTQLGNLIMNNPGLKIFQYNGLELAYEHAHLVIGQLKGHQNIVLLDLFNTNMTHQSAYFAVSSTRENPAITRINLGGNDLLDAQSRESLQKLIETYSHINLAL